MSRVFYKVFLQLKNIAYKVENKESFENAGLFHIDELNEVSKYIANTYNQLCKTKDELASEKEKLFKHLYFSREGLAIFSEFRKCIIVNELFIQYINLISGSQLKEPEDIFATEEFSGIMDFLSKNINSELSYTGIAKENFFIESNHRIFSIQCILFEDKSFEISINDITQQEEQQKIKKQLTQNIAHELKTPVSSIVGYLETIINSPQLDDERKRFFIERTYTQANRLSHLVNEISLLNKIDSESEFFEKTTLNLSEIIHNVLKDVALQIEQKHIKLNIQLKEALEMIGNRSLLYSIFRNLIDNSLAYAGENFEIILHCYREDDNKYYFRYADTGVGIPSEHINRIFERFYRVDKGRSRKAGGTGLGLAIVKNAILFHNGMISAKNHDSSGLEFLFTLEKK
jgi:signal transduction histidine kinase